MPSRWQLLAVDLDGTLLDSQGRVRERNRIAIRRAHDAGVRIVVCTGRGLAECRHVLDALEIYEPVVVAGGSMVASPREGRTLRRFGLDATTTHLATSRLLAHGHAAMILKDRGEVGYDYLMVQGEANHKLDPVTHWWIETMKVHVRYATHLVHDEHPDHTVRLGACAVSSRLREMLTDLMEHLGERVVMHHFPAVAAPEHTKRLPSGETLDILEVFSREATKWSGVRWLAEQWQIEPDRIAAIGDQVNDLSMICGVQAAGGLGIAMGNATPEVKAAAGRTTSSNDEHGVAQAIDELLQAP
jgi:hydroxymethylpyrimidine pyrophosphatase-like HAD family hydrolase